MKIYLSTIYWKSSKALEQFYLQWRNRRQSKYPDAVNQAFIIVQPCSNLTVSTSPQNVSVSLCSSMEKILLSSLQFPLKAVLMMNETWAHWKFFLWSQLRWQRYMKSFKKYTISFPQSITKSYKVVFFNLPYKSQIAFLTPQTHSTALTSSVEITTATPDTASALALDAFIYTHTHILN